MLVVDTDTRQRTALVGAATGVAVAALATLVLVLLLGGGAPERAPAGLPEASPVVTWALSASPFALRVVGAVTVGFALLGGGYLGRQLTSRVRERASLLAESWAFVWAGLIVVVAGLIVLEMRALGPGAPVLEQMAGSLRVRAMFVELVLVVLVSVAATLLPRLTLPFALLALAPEMLTGHVRTADSPIVVGSSLVIHVVAASLWVGGLIVLGWLALRHTSAWGDALPRYSQVALLSIVALAITGTITALSRVGSLDQLFGSAYGIVVLLKALALVSLAVLGFLQRQYVVGRAARRTRDFLLLAGTELTLMALAFALASALSQTPPPA